MNEDRRKLVEEFRALRDAIREHHQMAREVQEETTLALTPFDEQILSPSWAEWESTLTDIDNLPER